MTLPLGFEDYRQEVLALASESAGGGDGGGGRAHEAAYDALMTGALFALALKRASAAGGQTLIWIASEDFGWRFPEHVSLFLALRQLEHAGTTTTGNPQGTVGSVLATALKLLAAPCQPAQLGHHTPQNE